MTTCKMAAVLALGWAIVVTADPVTVSFDAGGRYWGGEPPTYGEQLTSIPAGWINGEMYSCYANNADVVKSFGGGVVTMTVHDYGYSEQRSGNSLHGVLCPGSTWLWLMNSDVRNACPLGSMLDTCFVFGIYGNVNATFDVTSLNPGKKYDLKVWSWDTAPGATLSIIVGGSSIGTAPCDSTTPSASATDSTGLTTFPAALTADGTGKATFKIGDVRNGKLSGFQLVEFVQPPAKGTIILLR